MKAYMVKFKNEEWCDFVHASNSREARVKFIHSWSLEGDYIEARALREESLDNLPFTGFNIVNVAGYHSDWLGYVPICRCELCKQPM